MSGFISLERKGKSEEEELASLSSLLPFTLLLLPFGRFSIFQV
jgi:hypothetical protein